MLDFAVAGVVPDEDDDLRAGLAQARELAQAVVQAAVADEADDRPVRRGERRPDRRG